MPHISLAVEDSQLIYISTQTSAKSMWKELKKVHEKTTLTSIICLLGKFYTLRLTGNERCREDVNSMMEIREQLPSKGETITDRNFVAVLLCSLPESFSTLIKTVGGSPVSALHVVGKLLDKLKKQKETFVK